jgi:hypothetical protein
MSNWMIDVAEASSIPATLSKAKQVFHDSFRFFPQ